MASKPPQSGSSFDGVKQRVNRSMTKLSDRDTEAMAASELDSIARSLTADAFPPFLSAISDTRPSDKTPLRRHSLRLLSLISHSHPAAAVAPHLLRMLSCALRRFRDTDSSVRAACVDAVGSMAAANPPALAAILLRPLAEALLHEQDQCAQIAAALSLAAAVDAVSAAGGDPGLTHQLQRLLPRLVKLLRSNAFKAKPALISLLGSVSGSGGAGTPALLGLLVPCLVESLASEDWAARKAGAEALSTLAVTEKELLSGFRSSCLSLFESRRFDKVKIVRDSMNRMLDVWKDIPEAHQIDCNVLPASQSQSNTSNRDIASDARYPSPSVSSSSVQSASHIISKKSNFSSNRSPPPAASPILTTRKNAPSIRNKILSPPLSRKTDQKSSDWKVEIVVTDTPAKAVNEEKSQSVREVSGKEGSIRSKLEARRMLFEKSLEACTKSASRIVPIQEFGNLDSSPGDEITTDDLNAGNKVGDLSLIRIQLAQIESQQSSLLDLLQRFIGNSQNGIHSLETRVRGLEMALDEISRDLTLSSGRMCNDPAAANNCCRLPGAEFLSPKFWRRTEARFSSSRFSMSDMDNLTEREGRGSIKWDQQKFGVQGGAFVTNPLAEINPQSRGSTDVSTNKILKSVIHDKGVVPTKESKKEDQTSQT